MFGADWDSYQLYGIFCLIYFTPSVYAFSGRRQQQYSSISAHFT